MPYVQDLQSSSSPKVGRQQVKLVGQQLPDADEISEVTEQGRTRNIYRSETNKI